MRSIGFWWHAEGLQPHRALWSRGLKVSGTGVALFLGQCVATAWYELGTYNAKGKERSYRDGVAFIRWSSSKRSSTPLEQVLIKVL